MTAGGTSDPGAGGPPPGPSGRAAPPRAPLEFSFPSDPGLVAPAVERVMEACGGAALGGGRASFALRVAVGEVLANAVLHGNRSDATKRVEVEVDTAGDGVRVTVADQGDGFDPGAVTDPTGPGARERPGGRGLFLARRLADEVRVDGGSGRVTVVVRP